MVECLESRMMLTAVTGLTLVNADTGQDIQPLTNGTVVDLASFPSRHLSVRADATSDTGSVKFGLNKKRSFHIDSLAPFALAGDDRRGDYHAWTPSVGTVSLTAAAYTRRQAAGKPADAIAVQFDVIDSQQNGATGAVPRSTSAGKPPIGTNWSLKFGEEFDAPPAPRTWVQSIWGITHLSAEAAEIYDPSAVTASNGILSLTARKESLGGKTYISGMLNTGGIAGKQSPGLSFKYGYVEARIKVPAGKGLWPAFWMLPTPNADGTIHDGDGEIDIMEFLGDQTDIDQVHLHHGRVWGQAVDAGVDLSKDFHNYAVDWEPDHITWYLDGQPVYSVTDASAVPSVPEYLIVNLSVGGPNTWPGSPNKTTAFPASMQVDWVHVWQQAA